MQSELNRLTPEELERYEFYEKASIFCYDINEILGTDYAPYQQYSGAYAICDKEPLSTVTQGTADEVLDWLRNRYKELKYPNP